MVYILKQGVLGYRYNVLDLLDRGRVAFNILVKSDDIETFEKDNPRAN